ncbi:hypothetical protein WR25_02842 [Diploscapter pachys]|uniref:Amino acid permease/ SLC12A domain-containing protein n=1 Tax=Diploscapter pachys TaxID=2018661 RepID=A0A2A2KQ13_9BILA|nr:hypothetical protein WR25_02842 [Diploscapter pachys]
MFESKKEGHKMGVISAVAYTVGDIVGSGIFVSPTAILKYSGSVGLSLIIWAATALISLIGALCYIELGTAIRRKGNDFAYLSYFRWRPVATAFLYVSILLSYPSTMSIQSITLGEYVVTGLNGTMHIEPSMNFILFRFIGFVFLWPLMFLNFFSLGKMAAPFQILVTICKILVSGTIVVTGFYYLIFKGYTHNFHDSFHGTTHKPGDVVLALYSGLFAYNGWDVLNFGGDEIKNPKRTLPIAAIAGISISAVLYLSMNIAYFSVLSLDEFKGHDAVAVIFAERTLGNFQYAMPFLIAIMMMGSLNTGIFACSRYAMAGAANRVAPSPLAVADTNFFSPRMAVLFEVLVAVGLSFIGDLDNIISYMSFAIWSQRLLTQTAFIYYKWKGYCDWDSAINLPIAVPILFWCICLALLTVSVWKDFYVAIYGLSIIAGGFVVYFLFVFPNTLPRFVHQIEEKLMVITQCIFIAMPMFAPPDSEDIYSRRKEFKTKL